MENLDVTIGNTVDFFVNVEGMSDSPTEAKLELYRKKEYPNGLSDIVETFNPSSVDGTTILFVFETEGIASRPSTLYGRFFVEDNGKKINSYFKMKFAY